MTSRSPKEIAEQETMTGGSGTWLLALLEEAAEWGRQKARLL